MRSRHGRESTMIACTLCIVGHAPVEAPEWIGQIHNGPAELIFKPLPAFAEFLGEIQIGESAKIAVGEGVGAHGMAFPAPVGKL